MSEQRSIDEGVRNAHSRALLSDEFRARREALHICTTLKAAGSELIQRLIVRPCLMDHRSVEYDERRIREPSAGTHEQIRCENGMQMFRDQSVRKAHDDLPAPHFLSQ